MFIESHTAQIYWKWHFHRKPFLLTQIHDACLEMIPSTHFHGLFASLLFLKACFFLPEYLALLGTDGKKLPSDHRLDIEKTKSSLSLNSLILNSSSAAWRNTALQPINGSGCQHNIQSACWLLPTYRISFWLRLLGDPFSMRLSWPRMQLEHPACPAFAASSLPSQNWHYFSATLANAFSKNVPCKTRILIRPSEADGLLPPVPPLLSFSEIKFPLDQTPLILCWHLIALHKLCRT